jgi:hypothetical protein
MPSRDPVEYRYVLGHHLAAVEHQHRHVALGIDVQEIRFGLGDLLMQVDASSSNTTPASSNAM